MLDRRKVLVGAAAAPLFAAAPAPAQAQTGPYPLETLFRPPALLGARLSPSGARIALLLDGGGGEARDLKIEIIDAANPAVGAVRFNVGAVEVNWLAWAGESRMLLGASEPSKLTISGSSRGSTIALDLDYQRVLSLPLDGSEPAVLFVDGRFRSVLNLAELVVPLDSGHALMAALDPLGRSSGATMMGNFSTEANRVEFSVVSLFRADLATGGVERLAEGTAGTVRWEAQGGQPILRRDLDDVLGTETWWIRPPGAGDWRRSRRQNAADPDLVFLAPSEAPGVIWVLGREGGGGPRAVRQWDLASDALGAPVSARPRAEPAAVIIDRQGRFVLAEYRADDGVSYDAAERALPAHLKAVQGFVGGSARVRLLEIDAVNGRMLARAAGPDRPPALLLYDRPARRVIELANAAPWLAPERLGSARTLGPASLVAPLSGAPGPLVVVVRPTGGDPSAHDFDPYAQAFAARGWWTLLAAEGTGLESLVARAIQENGLDPGKVAVMGWAEAARPALALARTRRWRAAVAQASPDPDPVLIGGAETGARGDISQEARDGDLAILLLRPSPSRALGPASEKLIKAVFTRDAVGGTAAAVEAVRGHRARGWDTPATQLKRAQAVVEFLARAFA